ncbi:charged multivesicular body 2b [Brachionus plicatilis]|uniref:Charged multivesicular body 2b n=1 Tax=Brachionus plicatilis TaxID=10195 RepID=A0A3M7S037_BRAPC|nr:charged multivesicular body 2b [Brachionus plicatilis]
MNNLFGKKDVKEEMKAQNKVLRSAQRDIERDKSQLEREIKKIELEIKKMAKAGNKQACTILAKQLIQLKKQQTRNIAASTKITGIKSHTQVMASNVKLGEAMKTTTQTMVEMNKIQDPVKTAQIMKEFEKQSMKMGMTEDMINETLEDVLEGSDDEQQSDAIVNKVLDEIGIEISGKMINAPGPAKNKLQDQELNDEISDKEIQNLLANLKA